MGGVIKDAPEEAVVTEEEVIVTEEAVVEPVAESAKDEL